MDPLFTATINSKNIEDKFLVYFENEKYVFQSEGDVQFKLMRTHDEWKVEGNVDEQVKDEAIRQLEKYLLAQH